ncbi:MAG: stage IV sporulation protein A, partial [Eubacterium sp.]|nr:stage IV sporulation protein A [Eubacterium sp.]
MDKYNVYQDISKRTGGELFFGVVGPVRTGKSTFIKKFMELIVLPEIQNPDEKQRTIDELPQSASGRLVMTTEPKFIPKQGAKITFLNKETGKIRLIDCVGFLVPGAVDSVDEQERMVRTPWDDNEIPFSKAAAIGTEKVIHDHSNVGIVVTSDGSFGELRRENFEEAERETVAHCYKANKPFVIILNTITPHADETRELCERMEQKYGKKVLPLNIKEMQKMDID